MASGMASRAEGAQRLRVWKPAALPGGVHPPPLFRGFPHTSPLAFNTGGEGQLDRTDGGPGRTARASVLRLIARVDSLEVGRLELAEGSVTLGRSACNNLVVDHPTVSGRHAEAHFMGGQLLIRDLGTTNGTRYQGSRIREVLVPPGATLKLGSAELRIEDARTQEVMRLGPLVSSALSMQPVLAQLQKAAQTEITVLLRGLRGETDTGKDVAARALHAESRRAQAPWVVVDCGALPAELAPAELFGHT